MTRYPLFVHGHYHRRLESPSSCHSIDTADMLNRYYCVHSREAEINDSVIPYDMLLIELIPREKLRKRKRV